jgi:hypothetical protein
MNRTALCLALQGLLFTIAPIGLGRAWAAETPASAESAIPAAWLKNWQSPAPADRPLQIVHGIDLSRPTPEGVGQMVTGGDSQRRAQRKMSLYKDRGLGGVVCNVSFNRYLQSEENWKQLVAGVDACAALGLVVWIYDEEGYPSGSAGGLVLKENRALEALALAYDPSRSDPFLLRPAYEHTHASNNYHAARRYINLIDDRAVRSFISHTHDAYFQHLKPHFGKTIQAMFTDEPSLITVNLGQIPEDVRKNVRVVDPVDPAVRPLPSVPWSYDLAERYRERYGEDLTAQRKSLFAGTSPDDRRVRSQYWALIADLVADRYFGSLQKWCTGHGVASSGHTLWEEEIMHHPALDGNKLKALARMDIPGLDVLTSDPEAVIYGGWMTAGMPCSAAILNGGRRVMTEVSDFAQTMGNQGPAGLAEMQATAAWQATWGVTEFTLYYSLDKRSAADYRAYGNYVGRLNTLLKPARIDREVLLYYPVRDLWAEYLPVAQPLAIGSQSPRAQRIVASFSRLGEMLQRSQIPFAMIDHEFLAAAKPDADGSLAVGEHRFKALVLPADVELPQQAAAVVEQFRSHGGRVVVDGGPAGTISKSAILKQIQPQWQIAPASDRIALGSFVRDGRRILLLANVGKDAYQGSISMSRPDDWQLLDPASGAIRAGEKINADHVKLALAPRQAILFVQGK